MDPAAREATPEEIVAALEHTLLAPGATPRAIESLCDEARAFGFVAVCVNGVHVGRCARRLAGSAVRVCAVVGFPLGASAPPVKEREAEVALADGAQELDMVPDLGALLAGEHRVALEDVRRVVERARPQGATVKVILETGLLAREQIVAACRICEDAGAHFVKTSTGFGPRGATREDVELLRASVGPRMGVKAAGGVRTARFARELLAAGATRIGSSSSVAIVREAQLNRVSE